MTEQNEKPQEDTQPEEKSQFDRAPRQKDEHRDPVNSAETIKDVPLRHGVLK